MKCRSVELIVGAMVDSVTIDAIAMLKSDGVAPASQGRLAIAGEMYGTHQLRTPWCGIFREPTSLHSSQLTFVTRAETKEQSLTYSSQTGRAVPHWTVVSSKGRDPMISGLGLPIEGTWQSQLDTPRPILSGV